MFAAERRQLILALVRTNGAVSLRELARAVHTSEVTVRRDVRALEADGLLDRRHGGAMLPGALTTEAFPRPRAEDPAAESAVADLAAGLVDDGDAVIVGAGTVTHELARRIAGRTALTVVTNSLPVAQSLAGAGRVEVIVTGGTLQSASRALVGSAAEQSLAGLRVRRAFLSGHGVTAERGLSTTTMLLAAVDRALARAAREVVVLADHSRLGVDAMFQTVAPDRISHLVTDDGDPDAAETFQAVGVTVHIGQTNAPQPTG